MQTSFDGHIWEDQGAFNYGMFETGELGTQVLVLPSHFGCFANSLRWWNHDTYGSWVSHLAMYEGRGLYKACQKGARRGLGFESGARVPYAKWLLMLRHLHNATADSLAELGREFATHFKEKKNAAPKTGQPGRKKGMPSLSQLLHAAGRSKRSTRKRGHQRWR
mmetsp:Transcript_27257/g.64728  ORF Transcript_27257/g.64728 Transcript_27257/m.64728 type:complete len:164 (-) Transcript_27257:102-593(-)